MSDFQLPPHFWHESISSRYPTGEPLTDEKIAEIEQFLGVKLPKLYLNLMKTQNGGRIRYNYHPAPTNIGYEYSIKRSDPNLPKEEPKPIENYFDGVSDKVNISGIFPLIFQETSLEKGIMIFAEGYHLCYFAFDYRTTIFPQEPSILYLDIDIYYEGVATEWQLAPDFATFLSNLRETKT